MFTLRHNHDSSNHLFHVDYLVAGFRIMKFTGFRRRNLTKILNLTLIKEVEKKGSTDQKISFLLEEILAS